MARKKKEIKSDGVVPEYIASARIMQRRKLTKRKLPSYTEAMMLLHAPEAQRLFWQALLKGLTAGDKEFVRMTGEIFELIKKSGGISLTQQLVQQNVAAGDESPVLGFDAFTRRLAEARATKSLPAPPATITITTVNDTVTIPAEG